MWFGGTVTAIADDDSEFPVCLTGLISICMHVCVGLVCSVEPAVESHAETTPAAAALALC
jgi:hypothetical protein